MKINDRFPIFPYLKKYKLKPGVEVKNPSLVGSVSDPNPNSVFESALHSVNYNLKITITVLKRYIKFNFTKCILMIIFQYFYN